MKIVSFVANKGGVGKTTLSYQFGNYLAKEKDKKVLFIDFDNQRSLSGMYDVDDEDYNVGDILSGEKKFEGAIEVDNNINLIPSSILLGNKILHEISYKPNKELLLLGWIYDYLEQLNSKYDYVIIDCNPAWNLITMNAIVASDLVISPMEPSGFGYESHDKVLNGILELKKAVVNPMTKESYVEADVKFIANRIKHNTASSREFLKQINNFNDILGIIYEKELINASMLEKQYIKDYMKQNDKLTKEKKFLDQLFDVFNKIIIELDNK